jgi:hypothetical protein
MAEDLDLKDEYDQNAYFKYKRHEADAFKILFSGNYKKSMALRQLRFTAEQAVPLLDKEQLNGVVDHLKKSLISRRKHSLRFRYAPLQHRRRLIQHIIDSANLQARDEEKTEEFEDADMTAGKATFPRFLEDIELCVAQAEHLWRRVAEGLMHMSTASIRLLPPPRAKTALLTTVHAT